ncbi:Pre-rRNA-processing protein ipi3 [Elasticomyces elasticus]|nr:Pre-rRNA-processing protein ipi3 [Elasticomyces elasticus]
MLTEQFIASIGVPEKAPATNVAKDAAIFVHEIQPLIQPRALFKKSATAPNCLAYSETHIFAAQFGKAVVHVYNREKGNQEATVPFTERITCIALACDKSVLILGTAEGRVFLWETCTGRQLTTSQAHLQAVTSLVVDSTSNTLLSGSADSTVHVWSIPGLLSFTNAGTQALAPLRTFTSHRAEVTALAIGHSASFSNYAVSLSKDMTCLLWNFHTNAVYRTYLLPSLPTCVTLDHADRAAYVGYEDGTVQQLDLFAASASSTANNATVSLQNGGPAVAPFQPAASSKWKSADASHGVTLSVALSFDGSTLLSGHQSGSVLAWDVASGRVQASILQNPLPGPVTNLLFLPVMGFSQKDTRKLRIASVVKPKFGAFDSGDGNVPGNYAINVELPSSIKTLSKFERALVAPAFPQSLLDEGLGELASWANGPARTMRDESENDANDFMALDDQPVKSAEATLQEENNALKTQLDAMRRLQTASFDKIEAINTERKALLKREQLRMTKRGAKSNGAHESEESDEDESMNDVYTALLVAVIADAHRVPQKHAHQAVEVQRRQAGPPVMAAPRQVSALPTSLSSGVIALITPSPGASPIAVTKQSQIVTSYVPQFTLCELPPLAFFPTTPVPSARPTMAPYHNYSISIPPGNGTCTTIYSQTETMVCDTTLYGLVTSYPVSNCAQEITFSSRYGYALVTPTLASNSSNNATFGSPTGTGMTNNATAMITPAPEIQTLTTYYLAPWQDLTAATAPTDVTRKVCQVFANGTEECITENQVWHTSLVTKSATLTTTLNISTTIHGPSGVIVWETFVANVTEQLTTFSMMTTMELEYQTEYTTTHKASASLSTAPTVYETMTVELASST